jgi:hypothetical protein
MSIVDPAANPSVVCRSPGVAVMTDRHDGPGNRPQDRQEQWPVRSPAVVTRPRFPGCRQATENLMTTQQVDRTVVTQDAAGTAPPATVETDRQRTTTSRPSSPELARRIVIFGFGLVQIVIAARFVLLLLDAREANGIVSGILSFSQLFVAPFEGILRTDALHASGSTLDITAIVAFVGVTIIEVIVLWAIGIFRREPA